jgi:hypothetical protein
MTMLRYFATTDTDIEAMKHFMRLKALCSTIRAGLGNLDRAISGVSA